MEKQNGLSLINKQQAKEIKESILHYLCDDFAGNQAIFNRSEGYACFNETNLEMVMDKVTNGIYRCVGIDNR